MKFSHMHQRTNTRTKTTELASAHPKFFSKMSLHCTPNKGYITEDVESTCSSRWVSDNFAMKYFYKIIFSISFSVTVQQAVPVFLK